MSKVSKKCLVVEDEEIVRRILVDVLADAGVEAIVATNGKEGLEQFKRYQQDIAFVVTDFKMPYMSGLAMINEIKKLCDVPVVIVSAFAMEFDLIDIDTEYVLNKPFEYEEFYNKLENLGLIDSGA